MSRKLAVRQAVRTLRRQNPRRVRRKRPGRPVIGIQTTRRLWERDQGLCRYCGRVGSQIDHVIPKCNGGSQTALRNLVLACETCNTVKGREGGFSLSRTNRLWFNGRIVAPGHLFGEELLQAVKEQRLRRQEAQGLTHIVEYGRMKLGGAPP